MFTKLNKLSVKSFSTSCIDLIQLKQNVCPFVIRSLYHPEPKPWLVEGVELVGSHAVSKSVSNAIQFKSLQSSALKSNRTLFKKNCSCPNLI